MKKRIFILLLIPVTLLLILSAIVYPFIFSVIQSNNKNEAQEAEDWGSFTPDKTYSYDRKYYAVHEADKKKINGFKYIKVSVFDSETEECIFSFWPARAWDFWGICWESDTYNIWIQSSDIGTYCYKYMNDRWEIDLSAERPPDILSRYD